MSWISARSGQDSLGLQMRIAVIILAILVVSCGSPAADNLVRPPSNEANAVETAGDVDSPAVENTLSSTPASASGGISAGDSPCLVQGAKTLSVQPIQATGTEPFWSAKVQGRCVTYSTPENQDGVRVWTQYSEQPANGHRWLGRLNGKPFDMRVRTEAACSDGMSDTAYALGVDLSVDGQLRKGCAKPL